MIILLIIRSLKLFTFYKLLYVLAIFRFFFHLIIFIFAFAFILKTLENILKNTNYISLTIALQ